MSKKLLFILVIALGFLPGAALTRTRAQDSGTAIVRLALTGLDMPDMDIFVDGQVQSTQASAHALAFLDLDPGTHALVVAPAGKGIRTALTKPITLDLKADDRYFAYVFWTSADRQALSIGAFDEKALADQARGNDGTMIMVDAILGAPALDMTSDGRTLYHDLAYGDYATYTLPAGPLPKSIITSAGDSSTVVFDMAASFEEPAVTYVILLVGEYPGVVWQDYLLLQPEPFVSGTVWDFLTGAYKPAGRQKNPVPSPVRFDTFVKAIEAAGLKELLMGSTRMTVFAPTDAAFARLPAGKLDALMADPDALKQMLENHITRSAPHKFQEMFGIPLDMLAGATLLLAFNDQGAFTINGGVHSCVCFFNVTNGRVLPTNDVLLPEILDAQAAATLEPTASSH